MGDKWELPKLSQTHVFRHGHIFCPICLEKILDVEKFCDYANEWEKKNHKFNQLNVKEPEKNIDTCHHGKTKIL